jgi:hypothetical protein
MDGVCEYYAGGKDECVGGKESNVQFLFLPDDCFFGLVI